MALTGLVHGAFPGYPPFGGAFDEVIPHLTVGLGRPVAELRAAEAALQRWLPIGAEAVAVTLMTGPVGGGRGNPDRQVDLARMAEGKYPRDALRQPAGLLP